MPGRETGWTERGQWGVTYEDCLKRAPRSPLVHEGE